MMFFLPISTVIVHYPREALSGVDVTGRAKTQFTRDTIASKRLH